MPDDTASTDSGRPARSAPSSSSEPAGLFRRLAALGYDLLLLAAVLLVFTLIAVVIHHGMIIPGTAWSIGYRSALGILIVCYFIGFWMRGGQTLGARAWRLRVMTDSNMPVRWNQALSRFVIAAISLVPSFLVMIVAFGTGTSMLWWLVAALAGLTYWWAPCNRRRLCLHDQFSRTRLIRERKS